MLREFKGKSPELAGDVFVADGAHIIGDVMIQDGSSVWFGAVIRGDVNRIRIGCNVNVQDGAVLHVDPHAPLNIGDDVTIGHRAVLHGCTIGNRVLIGMGSIVLDGAIIEDGAIIGAGALVPQGKRIPAGSLAVGMPAKVVRELSPEEAAGIERSAQGYRRLWQEHYRD